jgi:putative Holliday junction resolvase
MSFDFGTKRIGMAIGQSITKNATPLKTLSNTSQLFQAIANLIQEWQPKGFIVGLAIQPDGNDSNTSLQAKAFGQTLRDQFSIPVFYIEERLTSVEANRMIKTHKIMHDKDALAASLILESWFNSMTESHQHATN